MNTIKAYFPEDKRDWKLHLKIFLPIIIGSTLFALNGFVDNFMVGHISQGVTALSVDNSWTNIVTGTLLGISGAGAIAMSQFYFAGKYEIAIQISRLRYLLSLITSVTLAIMAWAIPDQMISIFLKGDIRDQHYNLAFQHARTYLRVIAIQWIFISITFNLGNQLREIGYGRISMYWGIATLATNITLNSIFMYGLKMGVDGAAWASVASRLVAFTWACTFLITRDVKIRWKFWTIWKISKRAWILFFRRWYIFVSLASVIFFITFRNYFFDVGYQVSATSPLGVGVGAVMIIGLTSAIQNVFTTTFAALTAMSSLFVASELGRSNIEKAKENGLRLKGFNTLMALILSLLLVIFAMVTPYMTFLSSSANDRFPIDHAAHLRHVRNSLLVVALYYPSWVWIATSLKNALTGGKGIWYTIIDWIFTGPVQLSWLAFLMYFVVPRSELLLTNFAFAYFLFFLSGIVKTFFIEWLYYKKAWAFSITQPAKLRKKIK